ncbi:DASS family divalent anion:Na+ symporter [Anaerospora hongkongensis]|uniref:DASS family divalent anion:Na+ symporter n=1 Tax=Anaerospora hongkongensis TaxID=244830 RepID=A0A4R1Q1K0_9FIRM|nr:anion permease [Anaerospora hongkongensis]TCL38824.1 DASS family divalent anion:Na+ symporter [Anaerospora hongkongensis]
MNSNLLRGLIVLAVGAAIWFFPVPSGLKPAAWQLLAIFVATILGFILQPLPIGSIAFISVTFSALSGVLKPAEALSGFGNGTIWLIVSAFLFAKGFIKTGLGRRIAYVLIRKMGDSTLKLGYTIVLSDLIISPATPSNTARAGGILFPIVRSLASAFNSEPGSSARRVGAYLMQTAYQGNTITSAMFMTAMAGNPLIALLAAKALNINITWGQWALAAIVPGLISLVIVPYFLYKFYPPEITHTPEAKEIAAKELDKMGTMSFGEKVVAAVFVGALVLWSTSQYTKLDATVVAMLAVAVMMITKVLEWKDVLDEKGAWDTLIWMGALIGLADYLSKLGFIPWFAKAVSANMAGVPWLQAFVVLLIVYMYAHYGFASLVAHITAMYSAFVAVAVAAGTPPYLAALALAFMSNLCMSLTHYAAGPAPILFGAGYVEQGTWWKLGFIVSVINMIIWVGGGAIWWKVLGLW